MRSPHRVAWKMAWRAVRLEDGSPFAKTLFGQRYLQHASAAWRAREKGETRPSWCGPLTCDRYGGFIITTYQDVRYPYCGSCRRYLLSLPTIPF